LRRQVGPAPRSPRRLRPALERLPNGLDARLRVAARGKPVHALAVELVADADLELRETVEHVELGERDAVDAAHLDGLAHERGVEPAATALAPRHGAELAAALADPLADLVVQLGRERPRADSGRIRLGDAQTVAPRARADARAGGGLRGDRVRRRDVGIGAVVDVEQRTLRSFEQDALAGLALAVEEIPGDVHE